MTTRSCVALAILLFAAAFISAEESVVRAIAINTSTSEGVVIAEVETKKGDVVVEVVPLQNEATARQVIVARQVVPRAAAMGVREEVDRKDSVERFALLTSAGPIVVEASITLNGKPFRVAREELIDKMLSQSDKDDDMKVGWKEALASPSFGFGRIRIVNDRQLESYTRNFDTNKNGIVERGEARMFLAQYFQGPAFSMAGGSRAYGYSSGGLVVTSSGGNYGPRGQVDVTKLLDTDKDGALDEKEIAAASERLKSRDADDNDLLYPNELTDGAATGDGARRLQIQRGSQVPAARVSVLLGPTATAQSLYQALQLSYKGDMGHVTAHSFRADPALFKQLDANENGKIDQDEVLALNDVEPHLKLAVHLGENENKGLKIAAISDSLKKSQETAEAITAELPGIKLNFTASFAQVRTYDYSQVATRYMQQYDKNKNEYLEKDELPQQLARNFEMWDADEDGKVFAKEITATYDRQQAPMRTQVRASAASQGNSLFKALDVSGDGRLGLREMRSAQERLATFDKNKDGQIAGEEIPITISVTFSQGAGYGQVYSRPQAAGRPASRPTPNNDRPEWFTRMDRNGDGDVTLKEFLGDEENFKKLDANNDGFIEPKEATAASE